MRLNADADTLDLAAQKGALQAVREANAAAAAEAPVSALTPVAAAEAPVSALTPAPAAEAPAAAAPVSALTPAAPAPKPTDAMLRGKELSQTQFDGMEPVYEPDRRGKKGALLGYKFGMNQIQEPGMMASYSAPEYGPRGQLIDPGGKLLGYDYAGPVELPKSAEILALEKKFGTTMDPVYATRAVEGRGGDRQVDYGPPIGYRFDNGNSQYVSYDATGNYIGTQNREKPGAFGNVLMSVLSIAFPPIAPLVQAYNAVKALDEGNALGFVINAVGAGQSIPGLDKNTISMLKDVATGAKIVQAVESKDPLKILSSVANLPNVDPDLKSVVSLVNTANTVSKGGPDAFNALLETAQKYGSNVSTTPTGVTIDGTTYNVDATPAGFPKTPEASMTTTSDAQIANNLREERNAQAQEQADIAQAAREAARAAEPSGGLPSTTVAPVSTAPLEADQVAALNPPTDEQIAQEQADREQAAREAARAAEPIGGLPSTTDAVTDSGLTLPAVDVTTPALPQEELPITGPMGNNTITDSPLPVSPNVGTTDPALDRVEIHAPALLPESTDLTLPPVEIRTPALPTTVAPKVPAVPKLPTLPKIPTVPKAPTGALPTYTDPTGIPGKVLTLGKMGNLMRYDEGLKQLDVPTMQHWSDMADMALPTADVSKAAAALAQYAPDAEKDVIPSFYAHGGAVQHFAEGGMPDVQAMLAAADKADVMDALKNLGNIGSGLEPAKSKVFQMGQMGTPYQPKALQQMTVIPQLAALLQSRGMKLAEGGRADHEHPEYDGLPVFRTGGLDGLGGKYVEGKGDGTSDDITAMLANGEYVFSADVVSALGNGSNKAGAKELDHMVQAIRSRARSAPPDKLPPDAKSPLEYLKSSKGSKHG